MIGSPGVVVDPYDDGFASLRDMFNGKEMPEFIKEAAIMEADELGKLPDHAFAVVVIGQGEPIRKYACADKAHTAVNVMYFLRNSNSLPRSAKTKAASNLLRACTHYGLNPPAQLVKEAQGGKLLIKGDGREIVTTGGGGAGGAEKKSEVANTGPMPLSRPGKRIKTASVLESPYVEVDYYEEKVKTASHDPATSVLNGQLSLLPYDSVIKARDYFEEQGMYMHPRDRHEFCVKLAARADQIGVPVSDVVRKYGSRSYAPRGSIKVAFEQRSQLWAGIDDRIGPSLADDLLEKRASMDPELFVEALAELDAQTGIDQYWDNGIPDPWFSVFGHEKKAAWTWEQAGEYLNEEALKRFASECGEEIEDKFGEDMAKSMAKNPTTIFDSLPLEQKRVIARMAQQRESGL